MILEVYDNVVQPTLAIAPIIGFLIGAGISAAASVYSSISQRNAQKSANRTTLEGTRMANEANRQLAQEQNEWNLEQWQREMEWQSPEHQVEQLTDAGMSQAGAVQAMNPFSANTLQSADLANQVAPPPVQPAPLDLNNFPSILGIMREMAALRKDNAEAFMKEEDASVHHDIILTDLDAKRADIDFKKENLFQIQKSFPYTLRSLRFKSEADSRLPALRDLEIRNSRANAELAEENVKLARQQFGFLEKMNEQQINKMVEDIKNVIKQRDVMDSEIVKNKAQTGLASAQAGLASAQTGLVKEETEGQKLENKGKVIDNGAKAIGLILKENGSPESTAERAGVLIANGVINTNNLDVTFDGMKNYVVKGRNALMVNPATRQFLEYYWDKGSANANRHGSSWLTDVDNLFGSMYAY